MKRLTSSLRSVPQDWVTDQDVADARRAYRRLRKEGSARSTARADVQQAFLVLRNEIQFSMISWAREILGRPGRHQEALEGLRHLRTKWGLKMNAQSARDRQALDAIELFLTGTILDPYDGEPAYLGVIEKRGS